MNRLALIVVLAGCGMEPEPGLVPDAGIGLPPPVLLDAGTEPHDAGTEPSDAGAQPASYAYPAWERTDIQPNSPRAQQTYGLEAFRGRTLVVVLLEGYCPYCQSNAKVAEQLHAALKAEKRDVEILVLADNAADQYVGKIGLRIFHDNLAGRPAWQAMRSGAYKHDTFVFAPNGLRTYFWEGSYTGDAARWTQDVGAAVRAIAPAMP